MNLDQKVLLCAATVLADRDSLTFDDLVEECFTQFPGDFAIKTRPHWPDSLQVNRCWLRCRADRGWLTGRASSGILLTDEGARVLADLASGKPPATDKDDASTVLARLRELPDFLEVANGNVDLSENKAYVAIGATPDMPRRLVRSNLRHAQNIAKRGKDVDALLFLRRVEELLDLKRKWVKE